MKPPPPVLYKFGKREHLEPFLEKGIVSFARASRYADPALTVGQQDDEITRSFSPDPRTHQILVGSGSQAAPLSHVFDMKLRYRLNGKDGKPLNYYIWCASLTYNEQLFDEFEADACVKITGAGELGQRLLAAAQSQFPDEDDIQGCDLYGRDVAYYDANKLPASTEQRDLIYMKTLQYGHQEEFRFTFATNPEHELPERLNFEIGSLHGIAEFCE